MLLVRSKKSICLPLLIKKHKRVADIYLWMEKKSVIMADIYVKFLKIFKERRNMRILRRGELRAVSGPAVNQTIVQIQEEA